MAIGTGYADFQESQRKSEMSTAVVAFEGGLSWQEPSLEVIKLLPL